MKPQSYTSAVNRWCASERRPLKLSEKTLSCEPRTADGIDGRIVRVRYDQHELGTSMPTPSQVGVGTIEVDRYDFILGSPRIAEREEKYPPERVFGFCKL